MRNSPGRPASQPAVPPGGGGSLGTSWPQLRPTSSHTLTFNYLGKRQEAALILLDNGCFMIGNLEQGILQQHGGQNE